MPGFTAEQATLLAAMITATISQAIKQVLTDFTNQQQHQPEEHTPDDSYASQDFWRQSPYTQLSPLILELSSLVVC
jgi:type III secretory pathway component EscV